MKEIVRKMNKWNNFRSERSKVIDEFIKAKTNSIYVKELVIMMKLFGILKRLEENSEIAKLKRNAENKVVWLSVKLKMKFKSEFRRRGGLVNLQRSKIRYAFSFM